MTAIKTEHAGAKNGGGYWGPRAEAKKISKRKRRTIDKCKAKLEPQANTARSSDTWAA